MHVVTTAETEATGTVAELYADARERFGFVPDAVKVLTPRPEVAAALTDLKAVLLGDASSLGARRADLLAVAVSGLNHCSYCGSAHAGMLAQRGDLSSDQAVQVYRDWRKAGLDAPDEAMLVFAEQLTFQPALVGAADVQALRDAGFDDVGIYDVVLLVAYRNFINCVHDGLGASSDVLRNRFGDDLINQITAT